MGKQKIERYLQISNSLSSDGLGIPTVSVYLSGCDRNIYKGEYCKGCQNPELKKNNVGYLLSLEKTIKLVSKKIKTQIELFGKCELCLVGGEPLAKINLEFSIELAKYFKLVGVSNIVYTWREKKDLKKQNIDISNFDRIVCGSYEEDLKSENYILGSTNQYVIDNSFRKIIKYEGE